MRDKKSYFIEEKIIIDAKIDTVWKYMTDWNSYPNWNPFIIGVKKIPSVKNKELMLFTLIWRNGRRGKSKEEMVSLEHPKDKTALLSYKYASFLARAGLLRAVRIQRLEEKKTKEGKVQTEYYTKEEFKGILARFVPFKKVKEGFADQANALKSVASQ